MKVTFEFEIDAQMTEEVDPNDLTHCGNIGELEQQLIEWADESVCFRSFVDPEDLSALWKKIEELRTPI